VIKQSTHLFSGILDDVGGDKKHFHSHIIVIVDMLLQD